MFPMNSVQMGHSVMNGLVFSAQANFLKKNWIIPLKCMQVLKILENNLGFLINFIKFK